MRTRTIGLLTDELAGRFPIPILLGEENALGDEQMPVLLRDARGDHIRRLHYIRTPPGRRLHRGRGAQRRAALDDVAPVGYGNWEIFAADCRPPLTHGGRRPGRLGASAVEHQSTGPVLS